MIDEPRIEKTPAQRVAYVHITVPHSEIAEVMGPGIDEVMTTLRAQGIEPTGPWFNHYLRITPEIFDFEICVPIDATVEPAGRVRPGERRAAVVARTTYQGPYEGLGAAWGEFESWIAKSGRVSAPDLWEVYVKGPESSADPSTFRTELHRPLLDGPQA